MTVPVSESTLDKISKLLRQAEGTDNEHERDTFFAAAQAMATRYEVELETLRQRTENREARAVPIVKRVEMGQKGDRGAGAYTTLFVSLANANGMDVIHSNAWVDVFGMPSDLDYLEALYSVLSIQMVEDCVHYIDEESWVGETTKRDAQRSFYDGFASRVAQRLRETRDQTLRDLSRETDGNSAMVLVSKQREVKEMYWNVARNYSYRSHRQNGNHRSSMQAGWQSGNQARMSGHRAVS